MRADRVLVAGAAVTALAAGLVLATGAARQLLPDRGPLTGFGAITTAAPASGAAGAAQPVTGRSTFGRASEAPAVPVSVRIPVLQVQAVVVPVLNQAGVLGVPADPSRLGWWNGSALAGAAHGSVVLDGHVDSATAGTGALFRLGELKPADRIEITTSAGNQLSYQVSARRVYAKDAGLPAALFDTTGAARLVLISCGGPFDRGSGSYRDNIVVFAVPA